MPQQRNVYSKRTEVIIDLLFMRNKTSLLSKNSVLTSTVVFLLHKSIISAFLYLSSPPHFVVISPLPLFFPLDNCST